MFTGGCHTLGTFTCRLKTEFMENVRGTLEQRKRPHEIIRSNLTGQLPND